MSVESLALSEVELRKQQIYAAKKAAEIVTLREWYDSTAHGYLLGEYFKYFSNLGRLGKELHKRGVKRVTELYKAGKMELELIALLYSLACIFSKVCN